MTDTSGIHTKTVKTIPAYPAAGVASSLREELVQSVRKTFKRKGKPLPKGDADVVVLSIEIDSHTVVELLACLDDLLPFKVTECVVKAGGYGSIAAAVEHVVSRVEKKWNQHHTGTKT
jgi:hypothetical protein